MPRAYRLRVQGGIVRLLDLDRLGWRLGTTRIEQVRRKLEVSLRERMEREELKREAYWTESLAVGSPGFLEQIRPGIFSRRETNLVQEQPGLWALKETDVSYGSEFDSKRGAND